jgi:hypothetical protein
MEVYQTERWHSDTFQYNIPLKEPGKYVLILKFSEVYFNAPGQKVFDIALGKKLVIKDLDIFARAGKANAHDEYVEFELKDNKVYINKAEAPNAYDSKGKTLKVKFVKTHADNPKINAIVIFKGDIMDTDFSEKKKKMDEVHRKKMQEFKKKYLIELRHHPDEIYDEDAALADDNDHTVIKEDSGILSLFFNTEGVYIFASFAVFIALNYALEAADTEVRKKSARRTA